ncbi:MAG: DUF2092 domain-containing protein [Halobacteriota archaeon]|nr:DUF2092 domain-containing protein [Halobacteriota archaeon]
MDGLKRYLLVFFTGLLLVGLVISTGCIGGEDEVESNETSTHETPDETEPTAKPAVEIEDAKLPGAYKYTMRLSRSDNISSTYRVWVDGKNSRMEMDTKYQDGEEEKMIVIIKGDKTYLYFPEENSAVMEETGSGTSQIDPFAGTFSEWYTGYSTEAEILQWMETSCSTDPSCKDVKSIGYETIAGVSCIIFEVTSPDDTETKIWTAEGNGYIMKIETEYKGDTTILEFSDIDIDATIQASTFELPVGVKIMDEYEFM